MTEPQDHVAHRDGYSKGLEFTLSICLCYTLCVFGLRLYIRWMKFGVDDFIVTLSTALAFVFFGCSYASSTAGLGHSTKQLSADSSNIQKLNALVLASNLSWITALCLSKLAIISMLLRTTVTVSHQRLQYLAGALVLIQCIVSIALMAAECTSFDGLAWDFPSNVESCSSQVLRWRIITGLDVATELAILVLPLQLVWKLQMSSKNKLIVIVAFWLRIPTLVFTILRNNATNDLSSTANVSLTAAMVVIWQLIEMSYSIAAATIAALKRFTESLSTGFGHGELIRVHGHSQNYKLSARSASLKDSEGSKPSTSREPMPDAKSGHDLSDVRKDADADQSLRLRPDILHNAVNVTSLPESSSRKGRTSQDRRPNDNSIRHDVEYSIHYDEHPLIAVQKD